MAFYFPVKANILTSLVNYHEYPWRAFEFHPVNAALSDLSGTIESIIGAQWRKIEPVPAPRATRRVSALYSTDLCNDDCQIFIS